MNTGKVKWFNNAKGYGFIRPDQGGEDLFVHYSYIEMEGYKSLKAGQAVIFELQEASKGFHAVKVQTISNTDDAETSENSTSDYANSRSTVDFEALSQPEREEEPV